MATALGRDDATAVTDPELWREQQRFYNFLQRYDLLKYHQRFLKMGVRRLTHFKDVTDPDLDAVGLTPPEKTRLRKKWDEHFSTKGKIIVRSSTTRLFTIPLRLAPSLYYRSKILQEGVYLSELALAS